MPRWAKFGLIAAAILAGVAAAGYLYLHTRDFNRRMERFVSSQIAKATGARVTFARFRVTLHPLGVVVRGVVVRGREAANQPPLATMNRLRAQVRVVHVFPPAIQVLRVQVAHPVMNVYYLPDGYTDLPQPPHPPPASQPLAEPVFAFGIRQLDVREGVLRYRNRQIPLAAHLVGVHTGLKYVRGHYQGLFAFRHGVVRYDGRPPLPQSAEVRFTLWPNDVRIDQLHWRGDGVRLAAHAMIHDLAQPRVRAHYRLQFQLARFGPWTGTPVVAGAARAAGVLDWSVSAWRTHGQMAVTGLGLRRPWALAGMRAQGQFRADNAGLALPALDVTGAGGHGRLAVRYAQWRRLQVTGQLRGFHLQRLMRTSAGLGGPQPPALLPPLAGMVSARIQLQARQPLARTLRVHAAVRIVPARRPAPVGGQAPLPVTAELTASVGAGRWSAQLRRLDITASDLHLQAHGRLGSTGSRLAFAVAIPELAAWRSHIVPWLRRLPRAAAAPPVAGELRISGETSGSWRALALRLTVAARRLRLGPAAADAVHLQLLVAPGRMAISQASWRLDGQRATLAGTVGLRRFLPTASSPLSLRLAAHGLRLAAIEAQLERWAGVRIPSVAPRQGRVAATLALSGTVAQPRAAGPVRLTGARADHLPPMTVAAQLAVTRRQVAATGLALRWRGGAAITGAAGYDWRQHTLTADLRGAGIALAEIPALQSPQLAVAGQVSFRVHASGPVAHPQGTLSVTATNVRGGGQPLGSLRAQVTANGRAASLQASAGLPGGTVRVRAALGEMAPYPLSATANFQHYAIDVLLRRFTGFQLGPGSQVSGQATLHGALSHPQALVAEASLNPVRLEVGGVALHNAGAIHLTLGQRVLTLASMKITGADTDFTLAGTVDLGGARRLQGQALGRVNLALLHALNRGVHSSGEIVLTAQLGGTLQKPAVTGTLAVRNASLAAEQLPVAFDSINGLLRFTGQHVDIQHLTAQTGGGQITLSGFAARTASGFTVALNARGEGMRVRYQGLSGAGNLNLHFAGNQNQMLLSGEVELTRVALAPNFDFALFLANQRAAIAPPAPNSWLNRVHLQVHVVTGPSVGIAISAARVSFQADLQVQGTLANPILLGRMTASRGEILFAGQDYRISKAEVTFANPFRIEPLLDVSLTTNVQQYRITLNISGPADRLDITYRSDPPLTSSDIVALLATGQTQEAQNFASQQSAASFAGQSEQLLGRALESLVSSRLQRIFGVTQIQFNPNAQGFGPTAQTTVTIEQQVRRNVKVTYTQNLTNSAEDIIRVDWTLTPDFGITVSRSQFGLYGLSLHFSQRAR